MNEIQIFSPDEWPSRRVNRKQPRRVPTPTERNEMDRGLVAIGKLLDGSGVWWQLEGALIISILRILEGKDYLGVHADIDLVFLRHELPGLADHLASRAWGMFRYHREEREENGEIIVGNRTLCRVDATGFHRLKDESGKWWQLRISAVDEGGKIRNDADHPLPDVTVLNRISDGLDTSWRKVVFPLNWMEGIPVKFRGVELVLSHPARFLFWKSLFDRAYDWDDLIQFMELRRVTREDLHEVVKVLGSIASEGEEDDIEKYAEAARTRVRTLFSLL